MPSSRRIPALFRLRRQTLIGMAGVCALALMISALSSLSLSEKVAPRQPVTDGYRPRVVPVAALPYHDLLVAPLVDDGLHDDVGVRMFQVRGVSHDHPVAQAQWGLRSLNSYRVTKNRLHLDRAIEQAQRNLDRKVESRGAWWYPYDFDLTRCEARPVLRAPWYSAMAQGQLLSLFVRLYEATQDGKWRLAADKTFVSLTLPATADAPWATWQDSTGHLWLEEYPESPGVQGERVLNGHIFAIYGVFDYWRLTSDPRAANVFGAAATTVRRYLPSNFRVQRSASRYSVGCPGPHRKYHQIHAQQLLKLYEMTHANTFAAYADLLRSDYPPPAVNGTVRFSAGSHTGYQFDTDGRVTAQKTFDLPEGYQARAAERIRVAGRDIYYRISAGDLAGWYVPEDAERLALLGKAAEHRYTPVRTLNVPTGAYAVNSYDSAGTATGSGRLVSSRRVLVPVDASAWMNGRLSYRLAAGRYAGFWLPDGPGLTFVP